MDYFVNSKNLIVFFQIYCLKTKWNQLYCEMPLVTGSNDATNWISSDSETFWLFEKWNTSKSTLLETKREHPIRGIGKFLQYLIPSQQPHLSWRDPLNHKEIFDTLGSRLNYKILEDFYKISINEIKLDDSIALLDGYYNGSLVRLFESVYPHHVWLPWRFSQRVETGYWDNTANQREFLDHLGKQLGFKEMNDWYSITSQQIRKNGGSGLLTSKYKNLYSLLITSVYSQHSWIRTEFRSHQFKKMSKSKLSVYWNKRENQMDFLHDLGNQLGLKQMEDWYNITTKEIRRNGGSELLKKYQKSPSKMIMSLFNQHSWLSSHFKIHQQKKKEIINNTTLL